MWTVWPSVNNSGNREGKASSGGRISCLWSLLGEISFLCRALIMAMRKISRNFISHHYNWSPKVTFRRTTASKTISCNLEKYMTFNTFSFCWKSFLQCVLMNLCVFSWTKPHNSVGKESIGNAGDPDSWGRKSRRRRDRLPTPGFLGFPCGSAGRESACNAGDVTSIPGLGRSLE